MEGVGVHKHASRIGWEGQARYGGDDPLWTQLVGSIRDGPNRGGAAARGDGGVPPARCGAWSLLVVNPGGSPGRSSSSRVPINRASARRSSRHHRRGQRAEALVRGPFSSLPRAVTRAVGWRLFTVGVPTKRFRSKDLVDTNHDAAGVHPLAAVDLEVLWTCHREDHESDMRSVAGADLPPLNGSSSCFRDRRTWSISSSSSAGARWNPRGGELFFISPDGNLMSAAVRSAGNSAAIEVDRPKKLFPLRTWTGGSVASGRKIDYDVASDGNRFLVLQRGSDNAGWPIHVVANWQPRQSSQPSR